MEMKKCKECGKLFMPKSQRQQYCDAVHYRPCPICGEPVVATYLSDPPRRCDKCKHIRGTKSANMIRPTSKVVTLSNSLPFSNSSAATPEAPVAPVFTEGQITQSELLENALSVEYLGKSTCGFVRGGRYIIQAVHGLYGYTITAIDTLTDGIEIPEKGAVIQLSSMISINQYFHKVKAEEVR